MSVSSKTTYIANLDYSSCFSDSCNNNKNKRLVYLVFWLLVDILKGAAATNDSPIVWNSKVDKSGWHKIVRRAQKIQLQLSVVTIFSHAYSWLSIFSWNISHQNNNRNTQHHVFFLTVKIIVLVCKTTNVTTLNPCTHLRSELESGSYPLGME